jgi:pilus assembly protein Flp/PilA
MKNLIVRFVREEEGQDLIEYALLCALVAIAAVAGMNLLAIEINGFFGAVATFLNGQRP